MANLIAGKMKKIISIFLVGSVTLVSGIVLVLNFNELTELYAKTVLSSLHYILIPAVAYVFVYKLISFYENFFHELTHMLFAIAFLENIQHFVATKTHGELAIKGSSSNIIISTSPYFFPLITLLLITVSAYFDVESLKMVVPVSYGFFLAIVVKQIFSNKQEVLSFKWYGLLFIIIMNFWISLYVFAWFADSTELLTSIIKK